MRTVPPTEKGKYKAFASGAITNGKPVVVNADGTVKLAGTSVTISAGLGSAVTFESASARPEMGTFDSNSNKVVVTYQDIGNSNYGTAVIGTIDDSDNSISFGTPVVFESATTDSISSVFDSSNNKVVIGYRDGGNSYYGTAIVGTVSGTSISFGTAATFWTTNTCSDVCLSFDTNVNKVLVCFTNNIKDGYAIAGTVSGTGISFGSTQLYENGTAINNRSAFDNENNVHVVVYKDGGNSSYGTACVLSVASNSTVTAQTPVVYESGETLYMDIAFDTTNNKFLILFQQLGLGIYSKATGIVGTVSGTSLSFGSKALVYDTNAGAATAIALVFNDAAGKFVGIYNEGNTGDNTPGVRYAEGTISGTDVSFTHAQVDSDNSTDYNDVIFDSNLKRTVLLYSDSGDSSHGKAFVRATAGTYTVSSLTTENYIGIASGGTYADGQSVTVDTIGTVNADQSSLTAGQQYFVQEDGTLGLTADSTSVVAGTAISATELIVKE